jgi:hypothetical protein
MSVAPANTASVLVSVHGVVQDPSTYAVLGNSLTFSQAPPSGTGNISCRYLGIPASGVNTTAYRTVTDFTATIGQTTFSVPSYTVGYIDVYRNGVKLGQADYTAASGTTVVLNNACSAGDLVETVSFYVSSVLNAIPAVAGAVNSNYLATGAVTQTQLQGNNVAGNGPTFYAYNNNASWSLPNTTNTALPADTKLWDTANAFNNTGSTVTLNGLSVPAYAFLPPVAGYYQVTVGFWIPAASSASYVAAAKVYKNGSQVLANGSLPWNGSNAQLLGTQGIVYLNGVSDYIQGYIYQNTGSSQNLSNASPSYNYLCAALIRSAT